MRAATIPTCPSRLRAAARDAQHWKRRRELHQHLPADPAGRRGDIRLRDDHERFELPQPSRDCRTNRDALGAQPAGYDAFSTLHPSTTIPFDASSAAPTRNPEYGRVRVLHRRLGPLRSSPPRLRDGSPAVDGPLNARAPAAGGTTCPAPEPHVQPFRHRRAQIRERRPHRRPPPDAPARRARAAARTPARDRVELVVGSLPWSAVMKSRSSSRSAARIAGRASSNSRSARSNPAVSFRCPYSVSKSTRLAKSNPPCSPASHSRIASIPSAFFAVCRARRARPANRSSTLPTPARGIPARREVVEQRLVRRRERVVAPIGRSHVRARVAHERARDHARDVVRGHEHGARRLACRVELSQRYHLLVRRDLEDGVRRGVDDQLPGAPRARRRTAR